MTVLLYLLLSFLSATVSADYTCTVRTDGVLTTYTNETVDISIFCWYKLVSIMVDLNYPVHGVSAFFVEVFGLNSLTSKGNYTLEEVRIEIAFVKNRPIIPRSRKQRRVFTLSTHQIWDFLSGNTPFPWTYGRHVTVNGLKFTFNWEANSKVAVFTAPRGGPTVKFRAFDPNKIAERASPALVIIAPDDTDFYQSGSIPLCASPTIKTPSLSERATAYSFESASHVVIDIVLRARDVDQSVNNQRKECVEAMALYQGCNSTGQAALRKCGHTLTDLETLAKLAVRQQLLNTYTNLSSLTVSICIQGKLQFSLQCIF